MVSDDSRGERKGAISGYLVRGDAECEGNFSAGASIRFGP